MKFIGLHVVNLNDRTTEVNYFNVDKIVSFHRLPNDNIQLIMDSGDAFEVSHSLTSLAANLNDLPNL